MTGSPEDEALRGAPTSYDGQVVIIELDAATATVLVDGVPVPAGQDEDLHEVAIAAVVTRFVRPAGRSVRAVAIESDALGVTRSETSMVIDPDGSVRDAAVVTGSSTRAEDAADETDEQRQSVAPVVTTATTADGGHAEDPARSRRGRGLGAAAIAGLVLIPASGVVLLQGAGEDSQPTSTSPAGSSPPAGGSGPTDGPADGPVAGLAGSAGAAAPFVLVGGVQLLQQPVLEVDVVGAVGRVRLLASSNVSVRARVAMRPIDDGVGEAGQAVERTVQLSDKARAVIIGDLAAGTYAWSVTAPDAQPATGRVRVTAPPLTPTTPESPDTTDPSSSSTDTSTGNGTGGGSSNTPNPSNGGGGNGGGNGGGGGGKKPPTSPVDPSEDDDEPTSPVPHRTSSDRHDSDGESRLQKEQH